jgi:predicted MPP superfamily phosphohydrolase
MSCLKNPQDIIDNYKRIVVIGDIHADFNTMKQLFIDFDLIDRNNKWIAKDTYVVQMGDQLDGKGRNNADASGEIEVLDFLEDIHAQAEAYNGGVFCLIGNHEFMNFLGDFRYVSSHDMEAMGGENARTIAYKPGGNYAKKLACSRVAILKIKDIIFVHGGLSEELLKYIEEKDSNIKNINETLRNFLFQKIDENDSSITKFFKDKDSLLWNRNQGRENVKCYNFKKIGHIIVGHTPQSEINSVCNNKIWRTDIGISKAMGSNNYQVLEIINKNNKNTFSVKYKR